MARDWYFSPTGTGTSGSGATRQNPIVGLSNIGSVGIAENDTVILLPGTYYYVNGDGFAVPQNNIRLISDSDAVVFDGTTSLNDGATVRSGHVVESSGYPWTLFDAGLNIWKKGVISAPFMFLDNQLLTPMATSDLNNSTATIQSNLQEWEYTLRTETTNSVPAGSSSTVTMYLRLPANDRPANHDIRATYRLNPGSGTVTGLVTATQKTGITFEGLWKSRRAHHSNGDSLTFWIDRCTGVENPNGLLFAEHFKFGGTTITGGGDIKLRTRGENSHGVSVAIGLPMSMVGNSGYDGGKVEIYDWYAYRCGSLFDFSSGQVSYANDQDGGVGAGYRYCKHSEIEIRDGHSLESSPRHNQQVAGWATVTAIKGSSIFIGTADPVDIGHLKILRNLSERDRKQQIMIDANVAAVNVFGRIDIIGNRCKNLTHQDYGTFNGATQTTENAVINVRLNGSAQTAIPINICHNQMDGGSYTRSLIELYLYGTGQAANSTVQIKNNLASGCVKKSGFPNNYGFMFIRAAVTGTLQIDNNVTDRGLDGGNYAANVATPIATFAAWRALGYDANGQQGTTTVDDSGNVTAGTANPIGAGVKWWGNAPRPAGVDGYPFPDIAIDVGAKQSAAHPFHPVNL